ncbi:hypothetical protein ACFY05_29375 [Microtetraspora fusca]|uniref:Uncharacterized protein n=1 Tax=Microtetraspora fusca TaxID=1997 RepID=A0ABW6VCF2_MICFU
MSLARRLAGLYPPAFRQRWGPDLEIEIRAAGARSWPNLAVSVAAMWLHPAIWPADSRSQRHARAATTAAAVTAAWWMLTHAAVELDDRLGRDVGHSWALSGCMTLTLAGLALVVPFPRPRLAVLFSSLRLLAVPAALGGLVAVAVQLDALAGAPGWIRLGLLATWWASLALGAFQACRVIARHATPPSGRRLRRGMWTLTATSAMTAAVVLSLSAANGHLGPSPALVSAGLLLPMSAYMWTLNDLNA